MSSIQYFQVGDTRFDLSENPIAAYYGRELESRYGQFNANADDTLTVSEIIRGAEQDEATQRRLSVQLMAYALMVDGASSEDVPVYQLPYELYHPLFSESMQKRIYDSHSLVDLQAVSTFKGDRRFFLTTEDALPLIDPAEKLRSIEQMHEYSAKYAAAWGVDESDYKAVVPSAFVYTKGPDIFDSPQLLPIMPYQIVQFVDGEGNVKAEKYYYDHDRFENSYAVSRVYSPEALRHAIAFVEHYRDDILRAAAIMHRHHPDIQEANLAALLAKFFIQEIVHLQGEDPLQDIGACVSSDCSAKDGLLEQFDIKYTGGRGSSFIWGAASFVGGFFGPYSKENQGYGPGQTILGLVMEAAEDETLLADYEPYLKKEDFKKRGRVNKKRALASSLDLEKLIYTKAMTIDYTLGKIKEGLVDSADVSFAVDGPCPLSDTRLARELFLISTVPQYVTFPEDSQSYYAVSRQESLLYLRELQWMSGIAGFPTNFPGIEFTEDMSWEILTPIEQYNHGTFQGDYDDLEELEANYKDNSEIVLAKKLGMHCHP